MKASRSLFLQIRRLRTHVRCWGEETAPVLVLLHGWGDVSASWQFVVDALAGTWRVLAPDWRGFGLSQGNGGSYWFPDYMADLDALLEVLSPDAPATLVGHSMGGNIACLYAGVRPERVARLVSLEGIGLARHEPDEAPDRYAKWLEQLRDDSAEFRAFPDRAALAARLLRKNPRLTAERAEFLAAHMGEEFVTAEGTAAVRLAADPGHRWVNPVLYRVEEAMACWKRIVAPTLWIGVRDSFLFRDFFAHDSDEYRMRKACFADIRETMIEDSGHNMHHDQPERVARVLEEFCA